MESNYEKMKRQMAAQFLTYPQAEMIRRFGLTADADFLSFPFLGGDCRVERKTGKVWCRLDGDAAFYEADYNEAMTVYDLLCWSRPDASPAGRFVSIQSLSGVYGAGQGDSLTARDAAALDHREADLRRALARLDGVPESGGDAAARIPLFGGLEILLRFWSSDEEFPPSLQLLWDAGILSYLHYETVWFAAGALLARIRRLMLPR